MIALLLACTAAPTTGTLTERTFAHQEAAFAHLRAGRPCEAVAELEAAHALDGQPGHLYNRALALARWPDHCAEAAAGFDRFLAAVPTGPDADEARTRRARLPCAAQVPPASVTGRAAGPTDEPVAVAPWVATGVAGLGLAAGGTFLAFALEDRDDVARWQARGVAEATERYRGREATARDDLDRHQTLAWVGFGLAGAALSTAVTLWLWEGP